VARDHQPPASTPPPSLPATNPTNTITSLLITTLHPYIENIATAAILSFAALYRLAPSLLAPELHSYDYPLIFFLATVDIQ
jgi:hypothetical protein